MWIQLGGSDIGDDDGGRGDDISEDIIEAVRGKRRERSAGCCMLWFLMKKNAQSVHACDSSFFDL